MNITQVKPECTTFNQCFSELLDTDPSLYHYLIVFRDILFLNDCVGDEIENAVNSSADSMFTF